MWQQKEPLLLFRRGYWRLPSIRSWHTDIGVVTEAVEGYLAKLATVPEGCLEGRALTEKGATFATELLRQLSAKTIPATPKVEGVVRPPVLSDQALEILGRVEARILSDPHCFSLRACCESVPEFKARAYPDKYPKTGILACLARLTCLCAAEKSDEQEKLINKSHSELAAIGAAALGLRLDEANRLFKHWSFGFLQQYRSSVSAQERAKTALDRIRRFVSTGE